MTREEAMRRLAGSWAFETAAGGVLVGDVALLGVVAELGRHGLRDAAAGGPARRQGSPMDPPMDPQLDPVPG